MRLSTAPVNIERVNSSAAALEMDSGSTVCPGSYDDANNVCNHPSPGKVGYRSTLNVLAERAMECWHRSASILTGERDRQIRCRTGMPSAA